MLLLRLAFRRGFRVEALQLKLRIIKKFDYRFHAEPWKDSRDAVERSVNKLRGWCVGKEPNPEEK